MKKLYNIHNASLFTHIPHRSMTSSVQRISVIAGLGVAVAAIAAGLQSHGLNAQLMMEHTMMPMMQSSMPTMQMPMPMGSFPAMPQGNVMGDRMGGMQSQQPMGMGMGMTNMHMMQGNEFGNVMDAEQIDKMIEHLVAMKERLSGQKTKQMEKIASRCEKMKQQADRRIQEQLEFIEEQIADLREAGEEAASWSHDGNQ